MNSIVVSGPFTVTTARGVGRNKTSRGFSVKPGKEFGPYRFSAAAGRVLVSDGEGVVATFFLMRYQSVVARSRDINFARQFFRSSLFITSVQ